MMWWIYRTLHFVSSRCKRNQKVFALRCRKVDPMPYMKFKNWYLPNCDIAFPTEEEAWEYLEEME